MTKWPLYCPSYISKVVQSCVYDDDCRSCWGGDGGGLVLHYIMVMMKLCHGEQHWKMFASVALFFFARYSQESSNCFYLQSLIKWLSQQTGFGNFAKIKLLSWYSLFWNCPPEHCKLAPSYFCLLTLLLNYSETVNGKLLAQILFLFLDLIVELF